MTDPFAPKEIVVPRPPRTPDLRAPVDRLRRLGAPLVVLDELGHRWEQLNGDERRHAAADIEAMSDEELRAHMAEMEVETVASFAGAVKGDVQDAARRLLAGDIPMANIRKTTSWIDGDRARALAALVYEYRQPAPGRRKTLVDKLVEVIRAR